MFKNKMLVLLSLVSFGSVLCSKDDEPKGYMDRAKKSLTKMKNSPLVPSVVAGSVATAANIFFYSEAKNKSFHENAQYYAGLVIYEKLANLPLIGQPINLLSFVGAKARIIPICLGYFASAPFSRNQSDQFVRLLSSLICAARG